MSRSNSMMSSGQCRLAPIIPCIQDSSQLYDYCVKILFKLHASKNCLITCLFVILTGGVKIQCNVAHKDTNKLKMYIVCCSSSTLHISWIQKSVLIVYSKWIVNNFNKNSFSKIGAFIVSLVGCSEAVTICFVNYKSHTDNTQSSQNSECFCLIALLGTSAWAVFIETFSGLQCHITQKSLHGIFLLRFFSSVTCVKLQYLQHV
jgi:hypothetical protein